MKVIEQQGDRYLVEATANYRWTRKGGLFGLTYVYALEQETQLVVTIPAKHDVNVGDRLDLQSLHTIDRAAFEPCLVSRA